MYMILYTPLPGPEINSYASVEVEIDDGVVSSSGGILDLDGGLDLHTPHRWNKTLPDPTLDPRGRRVYQIEDKLWTAIPRVDLPGECSRLAASLLEEDQAIYQILSPHLWT